jgi:hypothetical protein
MPIIAKSSGGNYIPAPPGTHAAVCVDVVDLGMLKMAFGGKEHNQHKIRIVWQIEEVRADNKPYTVSRLYTLSLHEKASLRKDLESWRGRPFTDEELQGFDLEVLLSKAALLNVISESKNGLTYSNVASIMRLPKAMQAPTPRDYIRVCDRPATQGQETPPVDDFSGDPGFSDDDVPF